MVGSPVGAREGVGDVVVLVPLAMSAKVGVVVLEEGATVGAKVLILAGAKVGAKVLLS